MAELAGHQQLMIGLRGAEWHLGREDKKEIRGRLHIVGASVEVLDEDNISLCGFWQGFDELVRMGIPRNHVTLRPRAIFKLRDGSVLLEVQATDNVPVPKCEGLQTFTIFQESRIFRKDLLSSPESSLLRTPWGQPHGQPRIKAPESPGIYSPWTWPK